MSIKQQMQDKAAAMAEAMAERARTPQEIEMIRQRVVAQVQSGAMQPYIGVPLIQDLTKKMAEASARMAQMAAGMGAPATEGPPVADQVMQQATQPMQAPQNAGVEALPSNLPAQYAPGGLVAFADGGEVEHYQSGGQPYETPYDRMNRENREREERLRKYLATPEGRAEQTRSDRATLMALPAAAGDVLFGTPYNTLASKLSDAANAVGVPRLGRALGIYDQDVTSVEIPRIGSGTATPFFDKVRAYAAGAQDPSTAPVAPPAVAAAYPDETIRGRGASASGASAASAGSGSAGIAGIPGVGAAPFSMPTLPKRSALVDYSSLVNDLPAKIKTATEDAVSAEEKLLKGMTDPSNKAREDRMNLREAANEKDAAVNRALSLISLGFGIAGSKERTLAGALGNEGKQGIADLIRNEAASRAAREKLEDARDLFEQQKLAASKGDRAAAQAAGQRAAEALRQGTALQVQAGHSTNTERLQGDQLAQQGALGLAGLGVQMRGQDIQAAAANANLQLGQQKLKLLENQIAAGNERARATLAQAEIKARQVFQSSPEFRQAQVEAQKMSPVQAQLHLQQAWSRYRANALPSLLTSETGAGAGNIPSAADLLKAME